MGTGGGARQGPWRKSESDPAPPPRGPARRRTPIPRPCTPLPWRPAPCASQRWGVYDRRSGRQCSDCTPGGEWHRPSGCTAQAAAPLSVLLRPRVRPSVPVLAECRAGLPPPYRHHRTAAHGRDGAGQHGCFARMPWRRACPSVPTPAEEQSRCED